MIHFDERATKARREVRTVKKAEQESESIELGDGQQRVKVK